MAQKYFDQANSLYVPAVCVVDSISGSPFSINKDFEMAVGFGLVEGYSRFSNVGNNADVDTGSLPEDAWSVGGTYNWMTGATNLEVVSTSASDTAAGVGVRTISIYGLDANFVITNQIVTLNGTTPVAIPLPLYRINQIIAITAGTSLNNVGDINIRDAGAGTIRGQIPEGIGSSRQAAFTVPGGYSMLLKQIVLDTESPIGSISKYARIVSYIKPDNGAVQLALPFGNTNGTPHRLDLMPGVMVPEKTDFNLRIIFVSDNNTNVTCAWNSILKQN